MNQDLHQKLRYAMYLASGIASHHLDRKPVKQTTYLYPDRLIDTLEELPACVPSVENEVWRSGITRCLDILRHLSPARNGGVASAKDGEALENAVKVLQELSLRVKLISLDPDQEDQLEAGKLVYHWSAMDPQPRIVEGKLLRDNPEKEKALSSWELSRAGVGSIETGRLYLRQEPIPMDRGPWLTPRGSIADLCSNEQVESKEHVWGWVRPLYLQTRYTAVKSVL